MAEEIAIQQQDMNEEVEKGELLFPLHFQVQAVSIVL